jgi:exodeoxyribonuclease III
MTKIISWNVNSIRTRLERTQALLDRHKPDLLCLQETKVEDALFPHDALAEVGYRAEVFGQRTYNGVAMIQPADAPKLEGVGRSFADNPVPDQARAIGGKLPTPSGPIHVVNLYVVNGKAVGTPHYETKLGWLDRLIAAVTTRHDPAEPLLLVGDFNIAPEDRDVWDPDKWRGSVLVSEPERDRLRTLFDWGLVDLHRRVTEEPGVYTWWDYRFGAFHRGWGLRIDLALGTPAVAERLENVSIDREERKSSTGEGKPSDHAPLVVELH